MFHRLGPPGMIPTEGESAGQFDQTARPLAKMDGAFFGWALSFCQPRPRLTFLGWDDTRRLVCPGERCPPVTLHPVSGKSILRGGTVALVVTNQYGVERQFLFRR
jgi:hypothetical protein